MKYEILALIDKYEQLAETYLKSDLLNAQLAIFMIADLKALLAEKPERTEEPILLNFEGKKGKSPKITTQGIMLHDIEYVENDLMILKRTYQRIRIMNVSEFWKEVFRKTGKTTI